MTPRLSAKDKPYEDIRVYTVDEPSSFDWWRYYASAKFCYIVEEMMEKNVPDERWLEFDTKIGLIVTDLSIEARNILFYTVNEVDLFLDEYISKAYKLLGEL